MNDWEFKRQQKAERFRELLHILRLTGARPGEASHLEWSHIDLDGAVIVLTVHKTSRTQRTPKPRVIPLTQEVVDLQPAQARKAGRVIEDKGEGAREIVDFLAELKVI